MTDLILSILIVLAMAVGIVIGSSDLTKVENMNKAQKRQSIILRVMQWYGKDYDYIPVNVHGGLTFGEKFNYEYFPKWIEDKNFYGDINLDNYKEFNDYWIIGFDTAHSGDNSTNCSKSFVISETDNLLNQCLNDDIQEIKKYKSKFLRKHKLNNINTSVLALSSKQ